jgi:hypothetical protein
MNLFGFEIKRKKQEEEQKKLISFVPPANEDGALSVTEGGVYGTFIDLDGSVRTEAELVNRYRSIATDPIVDLAIQDIVNEAIIEDSDEDTVSIVLDDLDIPNSIKRRIEEEFEEVLRLLEFNSLSYEIFRRWYVDGRLYYHVVIDDNNVKKGIREIRYIDPRNIKKIREIKKERTKEGVNYDRVVGEYYIYNKSGFMKNSGSISQYSTQTPQTTSHAEGVKIAKDSVVYCTSGYMAADSNLILSYLHKAIRPLNQLRSMEDALVIYRISRAPERRIFYVDVGGLPKIKAEQYLREIMTKFKNKVVYDSSTGEIRDDRKFMTMLEDFWLPRRDGGKGTEITTLPGGQNLGEIEDVLYFQNLLFRSLNVPSTRLQPETTFTLGRATEITRDEVKFNKFIMRLRSKFAQLFTKILERQLILKGVCTVDDWEEWKTIIEYNFAVDNYFAELKQMEIARDRIGMLREMDEYVGKYYSHEYVRKFVLQQTDSEMEEIDDQIANEKKDPRYTSDEGDDSLDDDDDTEFDPPERRQPEPVDRDDSDGSDDNESEDEARSDS